MAKGGKWAFLRGQLPALPEDPTYDEVVAGMRKKFEHLSLNETVDAWTDLLGKKAAAEEVLSGINAEVVGIERVVQDHLERLGTDSVSINGVTISRKPEPNVKVADKGALMAWVAEHAPDLASVHHSTLKAFVKHELDPTTRADKDGPPALPPGVEVTLYEGINRTGKARVSSEDPF